MNKLAIVFIIKTMSDICYFFILARDYLVMFILTLILIISIINTIFLYLLIRKNGNALHNEIGDQNNNKELILNNPRITNNYYYKENSNKSKPSNYDELKN